jgi:hypothetical protein
MRAKILSSIAALAIIVIALWNVNLNLHANDLFGISLANVEALAEWEANTRDCPGGHCNYSNSQGESCSACCPVGKNPRCCSGDCGCN